MARELTLSTVSASMMTSCPSDSCSAASYGRFYLIHAEHRAVMEPAATVGIKQALDLPFG